MFFECCLKDLSRIYYTVVYCVLIREKNEIESSVQNKCETPISCNPSLWRPRKKDLSYCECCHQHFTNLEEVEMFKNYLFLLALERDFCLHCLHLWHRLWYGLLFIFFIAAFTVWSAPYVCAGSFQLQCGGSACSWHASRIQPQSISAIRRNTQQVSFDHY